MMERVVRLFWPERAVGLVVGITALLLIIAMGARSLISGKFDVALIGALLSSGGLIGVACAQTFVIFNRAVGVLEATVVEVKPAAAKEAAAEGK